ncbi:unnamed protein product [Leptidea sinapis]|uniref:alkaline phosphatase n=1 Tax=Leptidea sinapis TaxID=189913 RepID=A0A5E4QTM5_9NEOP|nr:unnamed protein product [Leptidea sinapis]
MWFTRCWLLATALVAAVVLWPTTVQDAGTQCGGERHLLEGAGAGRGAAAETSPQRGTWASRAQRGYVPGGRHVGGHAYGRSHVTGPATEPHGRGGTTGFRGFPYHWPCKADSACTASAYLCGVKANLGTIGLSGDVTRRDCRSSLEPRSRLESVAAWALADGRDAGIVTTTRVTHASPAGAFARTADRDWESDAAVLAASVSPDVCPDIAYQLVHSHPGNQFKEVEENSYHKMLSTKKDHQVKD